MLSQKTMSELINVSRFTRISVEELIKNYTIESKEIREDLQQIAEKNKGVIHECFLNSYGLTPRHVHVTFDGKYSVELVPQGD